AFRLPLSCNPLLALVDFLRAQPRLLRLLPLAATRVELGLQNPESGICVIDQRESFEGADRFVIDALLGERRPLHTEGVRVHRIRRQLAIDASEQPRRRTLPSACTRWRDGRTSATPAR